MVENEQKRASTKLKLIEIIFYYYKTIRTFIIGKTKCKENFGYGFQF